MAAGVGLPLLIRKILRILQIQKTFSSYAKPMICRRCRPTGGFALVGGDDNLMFYGGSGGGIDIGSG